DPPHARAVFEDGADVVVFESVPPVPADECAGVELFEAAVGADPEVAFVVFADRAHGGIEEAVVDPVRGDGPAADAEDAVAVGADPEAAVAIAVQRGDLVGGQSADALDAAGRDALESRGGAGEQGVRSVGGEGDDAVAGESVDALGVAGSAPMPAESRGGADPYRVARRRKRGDRDGLQSEFHFLGASTANANELPARRADPYRPVGSDGHPADAVRPAGDGDGLELPAAEAHQPRVG